VGGVKGHNKNDISFPGSPGLWPEGFNRPPPGSEDLRPSLVTIVVLRALKMWWKIL
jgi:hypothetical protein